ncbi:hypothetical protein Pcinc_009319 [Petrolisthes cinctipes]|uniref:DDE Tnp4 domain-containing protein n=1 Tax=Petrolisthes cinctipes TaxID=88211 RepID=A0AAE1KWG5_PETCI|nr:hypothetical protein Pcinc_009319 [Petrolisthes cinctipes]
MVAPAPLRQRRPRRFRERKDVLHDLDDGELIKRYRLDRAGIIFVTDLVRGPLTNPTGRNQVLTPEMKIIVLLRYLATGKMQLCSMDDLGPSQQTVSQVITETLMALSSNAILTQFITFPITPHETQRKIVDFQQIAGFPGVIGAIDGTHVRISAPSEFEGEGMVSDGCHLLGDSGYPSKKWLLTPYLRPQPGPQSNYNRAHKITRSVVERGIGQLKRRFHVLHGEIRVQPPSKVCQIIKVCAMLHNICKDRNIYIPAAEDDEEEVDDPLHLQPPQPPAAQ